MVLDLLDRLLVAHLLLGRVVLCILGERGGGGGGGGRVGGRRFRRKGIGGGPVEPALAAAAGFTRVKLLMAIFDIVSASLRERGLVYILQRQTWASSTQRSFACSATRRSLWHTALTAGRALGSLSTLQYILSRTHAPHHIRTAPNLATAPSSLRTLTTHRAALSVFLFSRRQAASHSRESRRGSLRCSSGAAAAPPVGRANLEIGSNQYLTPWFA